MTTPTQLNARTKHPSFTALPPEIQKQVRTTMQQAVRQQVLTAAAARVELDEDTIIGGGLLVTAHLDVLPAGSIAALQNALALCDAQPAEDGWRGLLAVVRQVVQPAGQPPVAPGGWDGEGFRPVRVDPNGLVVIALAPWEVMQNGLNWGTPQEISVSPPDQISRLDDVAFVLPDGRQRTPAKAQIRRSQANGEAVFMVSAEGPL